MIKKFFNNNILLNSQPSKSVISAAFVITMAGIASRVLGLVRDRFLASTFGAGDTLDVYYAAFRIPDLIYNLLIMGALSSAFIPVFTGLISRENEEEGWKLVNGMLNLAIFFIVVISAIGVFFAPYLMRIITPGFPPEKMGRAVEFTRIMFLSPLLLGVSGIFGGVLTSFRHFLVYSLAPIFYNLGIIIGVLFLVKFFGPIGLAWGIVMGALLHMLVQYPAVRKIGFRYQGALWEAFRNQSVKKVFTLMIPRVLGIAVSQINLFVITIFASLLTAGSLAIFNFAQNLQSVPLGLFGISFAIAVFPVLSSLAALENKEAFVKSFSQTFRQVMFFVIPLSVLILVLRAQLVRVVLGAGKFDWEDTILTFECLGVFSLSLFAQSAIPLLARAFYALQDTKTPFYIALAAEAVNIFTVVLLIGKYQVVGLAIAFSLASFTQMVLLLFFLRARFDSLDDKNIISSVSKIALASLLAGLGIQVAKYVVASVVDLDTFLGVFAQLSISVVSGLLIFVGMAYALKLEEFFAFKNSLTKKLLREKQIVTESTDEVSGI